MPIALVLALATRPAAQPADGADEVPARGFDHLVHEGKVEVTGAEALACTHCHATSATGELRGWPGHRACFGACHGAPPVRPRARSRSAPLDDDRRRVCTVCHAPAALDRVLAGSRERLPGLPPIEPDYGLAFSHAGHDAAARAARDCATCHGIPPDAGQPPRPTTTTTAHQRCRSCHGAGTGGAPPMSACATCHRAAYGPATAPHLTTGAYPVGERFSHRKHLGRLPDGGGCRTCHDEVAAISGDALPAPTMAICERCHDGRAAFATVGATCTRCHTRPSVRVRRPILRQVARFSHEQHRGRGVAMDCAGCHRLGPEGAPLPAAADHQPCASAGCHHGEFSALEPRICSGCHVGEEPWRGLHFDRPPPAATELGARFSHAAHLGDNAPASGRACVDCHDTTTARRELRLGRDHRDCTGAGCHADGGTVAPTLGDCTGCHELGLVTERERRRLAAPWSVRARFRHAPHRLDPRSGAALPCETCHEGATEAESLASMRTPPKAACLACHDGETAFKVTGHGCRRCHGGDR